MNSNGDSYCQLRPLYLATSIDALMKKSENAIGKHKPGLKKYLEWMLKWDLEAKKARKHNDQELEFLYLYRYVNLASKIGLFPEYKNNVDYKKNLEMTKINLKLLEKLQDSLIVRYREQLVSASGDNNNIKDNSIISSNNNNNTQPSKGPLDEIKPDTNKPNRSNEEVNTTSISCGRLYSLIKCKDSLLVLDTRPMLDFKQSHLTSPNIINISSDIIKPGDSASALGEKLSSPDDKSLWSWRHTFDKLVVLDWNTSAAAPPDKLVLPQSPLMWLRDAMLKWDPGTKYKCTPLILEGGYEEWLQRYPHMTTNPKVEPPSANSSTINFLDSCDYPMDELEVSKENIVPQSGGSDPATFRSPVPIDRSTKPKLKVEAKSEVESMEGVEEAKTDEDKPAMEEVDREPTATPLSSMSSTSSLEEFSKEYASTTELQKVDRKSKPAPSQKDNVKMLEDLRKVKPDKVKPMDTMKGSTEDTVAYSSVRLKRDGSGGGSGTNLKRSSSSPNIAQDLRDEEDIPLKQQQPSFTRLNKPPRYSEKTDATYGSTALGLTGLKNFANNCYMNSILQCLSNTEALVKELINLKHPEINSQSKTKGRVALEVIRTLTSMWSGEIRVYSIKELKELMGNIKDIFKGTAHQDSNEFLIILLEYLHEDLKAQESLTMLSGANENSGEKAWGEFKRKNSSVIQRLFYGQQKSTVTCSTCAHSSVTFEPFFNLFVPIPSTSDKVTLLDCIQLYMSGENITGWKCPKCQCQRNATKKFDISKLPPILIVALKRFTQEDDSWLHKKENTVSYPLLNLDMRRFTVSDSEQRYTNYDLYAVSTHSGTLKSGHYKAICKNSVTSKWFMFDDQTIEPLSAQRVKDHPDAYILFYNAVTTN